MIPHHESHCYTIQCGQRPPRKQHSYQTDGIKLKVSNLISEGVAVTSQELRAKANLSLGNFNLLPHVYTLILKELLWATATFCSKQTRESKGKTKEEASCQLSGAIKPQCPCPALYTQEPWCESPRTSDAQEPWCESPRSFDAQEPWCESSRTMVLRSPGVTSLPGQAFLLGALNWHRELTPSPTS